MATNILSNLTAAIGIAVVPACDSPLLHRDLTATPSVSPALWTAPRREATAPKGSFVRLKEHLDYLKRVSTEGVRPPITRDTAAQARAAWWAVWEATGFALPVPAACTGPDGQMLYAWDSGKHHLELEIIPGQAAEFFYRNRATGALWGEDYVVGQPVSAAAVQKLKLFV